MARKVYGADARTGGTGGKRTVKKGGRKARASQSACAGAPRAAPPGTGRDALQTTASTADAEKERRKQRRAAAAALAAAGTPTSAGTGARGPTADAASTAASPAGPAATAPA